MNISDAHLFYAIAHRHFSTTILKEEDHKKKCLTSLTATHIDGKIKVKSNVFVCTPFSLRNWKIQPSHRLTKMQNATSLFHQPGEKKKVTDKILFFSICCFFFYSTWRELSNTQKYGFLRFDILAKRTPRHFISTRRGTFKKLSTYLLLPPSQSFFRSCQQQIGR